VGPRHLLPVAALAVIASGLPGCGSEATSSAPAVRFQGALLPPGVRAPQFGLRDQDGRPLRSTSLGGHVTVVALVHTHCLQCEVLAQQLKGALDDLRTPVPTVAISTEPATDTRASARRFLARVGLGGRMRFLLGSPHALAAVWRGFSIRPHQEPLVVIVDARGIQRVAFPVSQATPERIAHDLRALGAR